MPIPEMNAEGYLPSGVHDCSLEEIKERFGRFCSSDHRCRLCEKLEEYITEIGRSGLVAEVIVDGSFVTSKEDPNDIDLVIVLRSDHDHSSDLRPFEYNVLSKRRVRRKYAFDILVAREGHPEYAEYVEFFKQVRGRPDLQKGILRIRP